MIECVSCCSKFIFDPQIKSQFLNLLLILSCSISSSPKLFSFFPVPRPYPSTGLNCLHGGFLYSVPLKRLCKEEFLLTRALQQKDHPDLASFPGKPCLNTEEVTKAWSLKASTSVLLRLKVGLQTGAPWLGFSLSSTWTYLDGK